MQKRNEIVIKSGDTVEDEKGPKKYQIGSV